MARTLTVHTAGLTEPSAATPAKQAKVLLNRLSAQIRRGDPAQSSQFELVLASVPVLAGAPVSNTAALGSAPDRAVPGFSRIVWQRPPPVSVPL